MMTYADVKAVLGPVDDVVVTDIVRTGASREELTEALAWVENDESLVNDMRRPPSGNVAALIEILEGDEEDDAEAPAAGTDGG